MLEHAEDTDRTGLDVTPDGEENWLVGWLDGVRGGHSLPGSGVELTSHFGGMITCLGGRGSRRVSRSGAKWLSDSKKKKEKAANHIVLYHNM